MARCYLRKATIEDAGILLEWRNDEETRKNSFQQNEVSQSEHFAWMRKVLKNLGIRLYILVNEGNVPVGQVRLDFDDKDIGISYTISPDYRGRGYGKLILQLAENELIKFGELNYVLNASVLKHNIASKKIFEDLGYSQEELDDCYYYRRQIRSCTYIIER